MTGTASFDANWAARTEARVPRLVHAWRIDWIYPGDCVWQTRDYQSSLAGALAVLNRILPGCARRVVVGSFVVVELRAGEPFFHRRRVAEMERVA